MNPIHKLMLASTSPRRAQLLQEAGITFEQVAPTFDDSNAELRGDPHALCAILAQTKAHSVATQRASGIVLGCDTLLNLNGRSIGKPTDRAHARNILESLFDRPHDVISAVALIEIPGERTARFEDTAHVRIHHPGEDELESYLSSDAWCGKAGGYNLAELQDRWRIDVDGDPTTVIGLPMQMLKGELQRFAPNILNDT